MLLRATFIAAAIFTAAIGSASPAQSVRRGGVVVSEREDGGSGRHGGDYGAGDGHQD